MAYDSQSFLGKLRENNVLRPEGQGLPTPLIGMPDFTYGGGNRGSGGGTGFFDPRVLQGPQINPLPQPKPQLLGPDTGKMNVVYKPPASDAIATSMLFGEGPAERIRQQGVEEANKTRALDISEKNSAGKYSPFGYSDLALKYRKQELAEKIAAGKATDAEKQEYQKELIGLRGDEAENLLNIRGTQAEGLLDKRGLQATELQKLRGEQSLDQIQKRADVKGTTEKVLSPSQLRQQTNSNIQKMILQEPELAKFLIKNSSTGQFEIDPKADAKTRSLINQRINGENVDLSNDITLPEPKTTSKSTTTTSKTPTSTTPTASMLIKKYGG